MKHEYGKQIVWTGQARQLVVTDSNREHSYHNGEKEGQQELVEQKG